ncbi:MAG TPA: hypothetical protein VK747_22810 [Blastocatellia bacterium]|nr:hypothetical protein [Blastocatellia bacterium]
MKKQDGSTQRKGPAPKFKRPLDSKIFVVTSAQNATPLHEGFWSSLLQYCEFRGAELMVIPIRYKNATSRWTESQANAEWWLESPPADGAPDTRQLQKYLWNVRKELNKNISVLGDIKVQPTAVSPLTGFEGLTHGESAILGHTKLQLRVIATPQGKYPKILTTTGACTVKNYTDTRAGKLGEFHHTLGAAVVEVDGPRFHLRQINASKDGSFYDLDYLYDGAKRKPTQYQGLPAIVMGDTHVEGIDPAVEKATFQDIVPFFQPKKLFWHDLEDGGSVNHWASKNPLVTGARHFSKQGSASEEFYSALAFVEERTPADTVSYIVASNHNDWLHRWILDRDWKTLSPRDRGFYLKVASNLYEEAKKTDGDGAERLNAFIMLAKEYFVVRDIGRIKVLDYEESCLVEGVECAMHGHFGPNGSRGSARSMRRVGVKSIIGHSHTPEISEGCYQVGTSTRLSRGYTHGPSSWLNTHAVIYPNGKRTLINIIDGKWRL